MPSVKTVTLFVFTALAEILGCYLPYVWLLTLHPTAAAVALVGMAIIVWGGWRT